MNEPKAHGKRTLMPVLTRLREIREANGEERMDLVRDLEVSYQVIHKWETDLLHQIDTHILHSLMKRYNVTYDQLIYEATEDDIARIDREKAQRAEELARRKKANREARAKKKRR